MQAEGPRNQHNSAAHWAGRVLNRWSKELPEVPMAILSTRAQEDFNVIPE